MKPRLLFVIAVAVSLVAGACSSSATKEQPSRWDGISSNSPQQATDAGVSAADRLGTPTGVVGQAEPFECCYILTESGGDGVESYGGVIMSDVLITESFVASYASWLDKHNFVPESCSPEDLLAPVVVPADPELNVADVSQQCLATQATDEDWKVLVSAVHQDGYMVCIVSVTATGTGTDQRPGTFELRCTERVSVPGEQS